MKLECCIGNCRKQPVVKYIYHTFPHNKLLSRKWQKNIILLNKQSIVNTQGLVCSAHFDSDCYELSIFRKKQLKPGSLPTKFPNCKLDPIRNTPTIINLPPSGPKRQITVELPDIPDLLISEEDLKFKYRLLENIEKAKQIQENIIYFPNLLDPQPNLPSDSDTVPEMAGGMSMSDLINKSRNFGPDDEDELLLDDTDDNQVGNKIVTKLSQITNEMIKDPEKFEVIKVLLHKHLAKLTDLENNLKKIHDYQQKKLANQKTEKDVYEKLQIRQ